MSAVAPVEFVSVRFMVPPLAGEHEARDADRVDIVVYLNREPSEFWCKTFGESLRMTSDAVPIGGQYGVYVGQRDRQLPGTVGFGPKNPGAETRDYLVISGIPVNVDRENRLRGMWTATVEAKDRTNQRYMAFIGHSHAQADEVLSGLAPLIDEFNDSLSQE